MTWYIVTTSIPELKNRFGSSDKLLNTKNYSELIEFNINNNVNFAIVINKKEIVSNILFFEPNSLCLYNKNIENNNIETSINEIVKILIKNKYLNKTSNIKLTKYENNKYLEVKNTLQNKLKYYNINIIIQESSSTIKDKVASLTTDEYSDTKEYLRALDEYSKDIIFDKEKDYEILTETSSKIYADNVYKKIENYITTNNVINQDVSSPTIPIHLIPADENATYYPTTNSWYYVKDKKIYAYIEFEKEKGYNYCYNGSVDLYKKGEC